MAITTSGAISLNNIQTEFGGTNPININEYYKGGTNVPSTTANNSIPTSGAISFDDFYGGSNATGGNDPGPGGGGNGCILEGELILLEDGSYIPVEDVVIGDRVKGVLLPGLSLEEDSWKTWSITYNDFESTNTVTEVRAIQSEIFHTAFRLNFNNGSLKITGEHPTLVKRQNGSVLFVPVRDITVGDEVRYYTSNSWEQITSIDLLENNIIMSYNLDAEAVDNYIAGGIVVHNALDQKGQF